MNLKIIDMDHMGRGIAKDNGKVVFVPKSVSGDVLDASIVKENKHYNIARVNKYIAKSLKRGEILCPYFETCGGCNISNLSYEEQIKFKEKKVKDIFKKYLNMEIEPTVIDSNLHYGYRNKITYHKDNNLGLIGEWGDVVSINNCLLVSDSVNELYRDINKCDLSQVKLVTIREMSNGLVLIIDGVMDITQLKDKCLMIYMNNKCVYKVDDGYITINGINYNVSYDAFFQINMANVSRLYDEIVRYGEFTKEDTVVDLYCGVGSISLYISKYVKEVLGIEIVPNAIESAKSNAYINNITNAKFLCSDVSKLTDDNISCDILIVDPPRVGLDKHTIDIINSKKIKKVIYVSCDPMTLVRDLKLLDGYLVKNISIIDMFPQTHHVESVVLLSLKK